MKTKFDSIPNEIPNYFEERDIFGQIKTKHIEDHKTLLAILNEKPPNLNITYANITDRVYAGLLDMLLVGFMVLCCIAIVALFLPNMGANFLYIGIVYVCTLVLYHGFLESSKRKASLGKAFLNLKVITYDGIRLSFIRAFTRSIISVFSVLLFGIGIASAVKDSRKQGWHDILTRSYVIKMTPNTRIKPEKVMKQ